MSVELVHDITEISASPAEVISSLWLQRQTDAKNINRFINDPSIYPQVKGFAKGPIDLSDKLAFGPASDTVVLCGQYGGVIFQRRLGAIYEMHTCVLPEGRGPWMVEGSRQAFYYMFTQTDCCEILTHCPSGNLPAKAGARAVGMRYDWTADKIYPKDGGMVDSDIYSINVQDWAFCSPLVEPIGVWFHQHLNAEYRRVGLEVKPHSHDRNHNKITGAAVAMIASGQGYKGISVYNRVACMNLLPLIAVVSVDPLVIDIHDVKLQVANGDFRIVPCQ